MAFKMKGWSPYTKNGDGDKAKTASTIAGQEIKEDGKGNYKIGTDYEVSGVGKVITDPKGILKKHTKDGFIEDLDFTYTTKGDTTNVTGIKSPLKKNDNNKRRLKEVKSSIRDLKKERIKKIGNKRAQGNLKSAIAGLKEKKKQLKNK